jgi:hypothetical protein
MNQLPLLNGIPNQNGEKVAEALRSISKYVGDIYDREVFCAGGACRTMLTGEPLEDIDLFFYSDAALQYTKTALKFAGAKLVFSCPEGELFTYKFMDMKVQLIAKRFYVGIGELLSSFDFTICRFGLSLRQFSTLLIRGDIRPSDFYLNVADLKDLQTRTLRIHRVEYPVATLHRITKYMKKGYKPFDQQDFYVQLVHAIKAVPINEENLALYID